MTLTFDRGQTLTYWPQSNLDLLTAVKLWPKNRGKTLTYWPRSNVWIKTMFWSKYLLTRTLTFWPWSNFDLLTTVKLWPTDRGWTFWPKLCFGQNIFWPKLWPTDRGQTLTYWPRSNIFDQAMSQIENSCPRLYKLSDASTQGGFTDC